MGILEAILDAKRATLPELRRRPLPPEQAVRPLRLSRDRLAPLALCAEIKRRSPSAGELSTKLSVGARARSYERGGASLVSVLTDTAFFDGRYEDLQEARASCDLPILCKDFVLDECQLDLARSYGADAVLLIVRCLGETRLTELLAGARERQLAALVEVTSPLEADLALRSGADLIGVNARDLDSLTVDSARAAELVAAIPGDRVCVHLSGIGTPEAILPIARGRADAALVGEALMREQDPEPLLRRLWEAARWGRSETPGLVS